MACESLHGLRDSVEVPGVAGGNFERISNSTCFQTLGSHSISVWDFAKIPGILIALDGMVFIVESKISNNSRVGPIGGPNVWLAA